MEVARFEQIKEKFGLKDDELFIYAVENDGSLRLHKFNEYECLA
jgi:hypothetical protein